MGGWRDPNSISDAEQLLCLKYPTADIRNLALDQPDATGDDVLDTLRLLGDSVEIPKVLIDVLAGFMVTYIAPDGAPIFSGGSYFTSVTADAKLTGEKRELGIVDSFAMSIPLALSTLDFLKVFSRSVRRPQL